MPIWVVNEFHLKQTNKQMTIFHVRLNTEKNSHCFWWRATFGDESLGICYRYFDIVLAKHILISELKMTLYKRESLGFLLVLFEMRHYFLKTSLERVKLKSIKAVNLSYKPRGMF